MNQHLYTSLHIQSRCRQKDMSALQGGDVRRIIEAKQALKKAHNSVLPSSSSQLPAHLRVVELDGMLSKRSPHAPTTQ